MLEPADIEAIAAALAEALDAPRRKLLRVEEVATLLDVSTDFVYEHGAELGAVRLGRGRGAVRFDPAEVDAYIASRRVRRKPAPKRRQRRARRPAGDFELIPLPADL
jgi:excisionase family DNA binding protein